MVVGVDYVNTLVGINISADQMVQMLKKNGLHSKVVDEKSFEVQVDFIRNDILHPCDIAEDIAIAYGYNNIVN